MRVTIVFLVVVTAAAFDDLVAEKSIERQVPDYDSGCLFREYFKCNTGTCISRDRVCDGAGDCADWSDESICRCRPEAGFICYTPYYPYTTRCLPAEFVCDGITDCRNFAGFDELYCDSRDCNEENDRFRCDYGACISIYSVCDGVFDCGGYDMSDERRCYSTCEQPDTFKCANGIRCVPQQTVCDGYDNCGDGSDEIGCDCPSDTFQCDNYKCIPDYKRCDLWNDCEDASDEINCACEGDDKFLCATTGTCIPKSGVCDRFDDCRDWSDERICDCTLPDMFWCGEDKCIPNTLVCDGFNHCGIKDFYTSLDELDEMYCGDRCKGFECNSGLCIPTHLRCNYEKNCLDWSDEIGCACDRSDDYLCANGRCINNTRLCDTRNDCGDWSDEAPGGYPCEYPSCPENRFQCGNGWCTTRCNGYFECYDGEDEMNCGNDCMVTEGYIQCKNGKCVPPEFVCDGIRNCDGVDDISDEVGCVIECPERTFHCSNGICVDSHKICDNRDDCGDLSDEMACFCTDDSFVCNNQRCVPQQVVCDGVDNCRDASDERHCGHTCKPGEFQCDNGMCINQFARCDFGYYQCSDYSDELNCKCADEFSYLCGNGVCADFDSKINYYISWSEDDYSGVQWGFHKNEELHLFDTILYRCHERYGYFANHCPDYSDTIGCFSDCQDSSEFRCDNGLCISAAFRCDGHFHCYDKSDEANCECTGMLMDCGEDYCIPIYWRCDNEYDCADGRDELNCDDHGGCDQNNGGCQHECVTTDRTYYCKCRDGYQLNADWKTCEFLCDGPNSKCLDCDHYDIHTDEMDWQSAKQRCEEDGGELAMLKTKYIHNQIREHILIHNLDNETEGFWFGLSDLDVEGVFKWEDGSLLSDTGFAKWARSNPNNNTRRDAIHGQDCVQMWSRANLKWDDDYCGDFKRQRGFICQHNICV